MQPPVVACYTDTQLATKYSLTFSHFLVYWLQVAARFLYGFEYLGAPPRLMCTPMVNRCFVTLTGALHLKLGGAASGASGLDSSGIDCMQKL